MCIESKGIREKVRLNCFKQRLACLSTEASRLLAVNDAVAAKGSLEQQSHTVTAVAALGEFVGEFGESLDSSPRTWSLVPCKLTYGKYNCAWCVLYLFASCTPLLPPTHIRKTHESSALSVYERASV